MASISTRLRASDGPMMTTGSMVSAIAAISSKGSRFEFSVCTLAFVAGAFQVNDKIPSFPTVIQMASITQETVSGFTSSEQL